MLPVKRMRYLFWCAAAIAMAGQGGFMPRNIVTEHRRGSQFRLLVVANRRGALHQYQRRRERCQNTAGDASVSCDTGEAVPGG